MQKRKHKGKLFPVYDKYSSSGPQPPWSVRRLYWLRRIVAETERSVAFASVKGMLVNVGSAPKTNTRERGAGELRRLTKEGYAALANHKMIRNGHRHSKNARYIQVTDAGMKLLGG